MSPVEVCYLVTSLLTSSETESMSHLFSVLSRHHRQRLRLSSGESESESTCHLLRCAISSSVLPTWKYSGCESAPLRLLLKLPTLLTLDVLPRHPSARLS